MNPTIQILLAALLINGFISYIIADFMGANKRISKTALFFISFLLSPIVGVIVAVLAAPKTPRPASLAAELDHLFQLKSIGAITKSEYEAQKQKLLQ